MGQQHSFFAGCAFRCRSGIAGKFASRSNGRISETAIMSKILHTWNGRRTVARVHAHAHARARARARARVRVQMEQPLTDKVYCLWYYSI